MKKNNDKYANIRAYLCAQPSNHLRIVAARAKVPEGELRDIVDGAEISEGIANMLALVAEPNEK